MRRVIVLAVLGLATLAAAEPQQGSRIGMRQGIGTTLATRAITSPKPRAAAPTRPAPAKGVLGARAAAMRSRAPVNTAPVSTAPVNTAPVNTAPVNTAPTNSAALHLLGQIFSLVSSPPSFSQLEAVRKYVAAQQRTAR